MKSTIAAKTKDATRGSSASGSGSGAFLFREKVEKARKRFEEAGFNAAYFRQLEQSYDAAKPAQLSTEDHRLMDENYARSLLALAEQHTAEIQQLQQQVNAMPGNGKAQPGVEMTKKVQTAEKPAVRRRQAPAKAGFDIDQAQSWLVEAKTRLTGESPSNGDACISEEFLLRLFSLVTKQEKIIQQLQRNLHTRQKSPGSKKK